MNKIQPYKLGLRYQQLKSCFSEAKKQELLQPGSLLVSGWTVVEVRYPPQDTHYDPTRAGFSWKTSSGHPSWVY